MTATSHNPAKTNILLIGLGAETASKLEAQWPDRITVRTAERLTEVPADELQAVEVMAGKLSGETLAERLDDAPNLRWVQAWSAGVNAYPQDALADRNIQLTTASGIHAVPIGETVLGIMIAEARQFRTMADQQRAHTWHEPASLRVLSGTTLAVLGAGSIGQGVAERARAMGMRTLGLRRSGRPTEGFDRIYAPAELPELLAEADYVVNILPETDATRHFADRAFFTWVKEEAYYISVGRGATTDTEALLEALASGRLRGAALDVFEEEPVPADSPLWDEPTLFMMPHAAGARPDYDTEAMAIFEENLRSYIDEGSLTRNVVDYRAGY